MFRELHYFTYSGLRSAAERTLVSQGTPFEIGQLANFDRLFSADCNIKKHQPFETFVRRLGVRVDPEVSIGDNRHVMVNGLTGATHRFGLRNNQLDFHAEPGSATMFADGLR